jgi:hypothetical protein
MRIRSIITEGIVADAEKLYHEIEKLVETFEPTEEWFKVANARIALPKTEFLTFDKNDRMYGGLFHWKQPHMNVLVWFKPQKNPAHNTQPPNYISIGLKSGRIREVGWTQAPIVDDTDDIKFHKVNGPAVFETNYMGDQMRVSGLWYVNGYYHLPRDVMNALFQYAKHNNPFVDTLDHDDRLGIHDELPYPKQFDLTMKWVKEFVDNGYGSGEEAIKAMNGTIKRIVNDEQLTLDVVFGNEDSDSDAKNWDAGVQRLEAWKTDAEARVREAFA